VPRAWVGSRRSIPWSGAPGRRTGPSPRSGPRRAAPPDRARLRLEPRPRRPARTRSSGPATRRCPRARRRRIAWPSRPTAERELAEPLTVELADRVHRELADEDDALGGLVRGELRARVRDQIDLVRRAARLGDDERDDPLAPALRGPPDHRGRAPPGVGLEHELHLARVDVEAAGDDD